MKDNNMKFFATYHPIVLITYFLSMIIIVIFTMNPILLTLALAGGISFSIIIQIKKDFIENLMFNIPMFVIISLTNPLFSHNGETPLFFLNGNPVTLEAILYGIAIATMFIGVMYWCTCYNIIMTSDKFLYLFGKIIPKLSLVLSMAMRFVPLFKRQIKKINKAQKVMGLYTSESYIDKVMSGSRVFSSVVTWSLENAIDTGNSMKARGYGLKGRTNFSLFKFTLVDGILQAIIVVLIILTLIGISIGSVDFYFYPTVSNVSMSCGSLITYISFGILSFLPFILEVKENIKWKYYISRI